MTCLAIINDRLPVLTLESLTGSITVFFLLKHVRGVSIGSIVRVCRFDT